VARGLVGGALEVGVAKAAVAALGDADAVANVREVGKQRLVVFCEHLRARRDLDDAIFAACARAVAAHAVDAGLGLEVLLVAVIDQRVEIIDTLDDNVATMSAVAAVRAAVFDVLLAAEREAAVAALAGLYVDFRRIEELHLTFLAAPSSANALPEVVLGCIPASTS